MFGHLLVDRCAERGCWSQAPETEASLVIYCFYSYWSNATVSLIWLWHLITISVPRNYLWPTDIKFVSLFSIYFRPVTPVSRLHWSRSFCLFCLMNWTYGRTDGRVRHLMQTLVRVALAFSITFQYTVQLIRGHKRAKRRSAQIPSKYVQFLCTQLPIWYMLIRQVAALRHVKN